MLSITSNNIPEKYIKQLEEEILKVEQTELSLTKKVTKFNCATLRDFEHKQIDVEHEDSAERIDLLNEIKAFRNEKQKIDELRSATFIDECFIHEAVDRAEELLISKNPGIYQRAGKLVRIVRYSSLPENKKSKIKRSADSLIIKEVDQIYLTELLNKIGIWAVFDKRNNEIKRVSCREKIARNLIARQEWKIPVLTGVVNAPTLREDGSIIEIPGYDEISGILLACEEGQFKKIKDQPTKQDALVARDQILKLLEGFPFDGDDSKSVALSAILTALVRKSISTAPLHCFTAPKMASGKSLLADVVALIATGKPNSVISHADNESEERKRLVTVLIDGDPVVCFDNIEEPFGSAALCSIITQTEYKDRILGETRSATVPTNSLFMATGNNLVLIGDLSTRALMCKIDPEVERPEERSFSLDLRQYIPLNRETLVPAALTMLRAYHVAGLPKQPIKPYGRFEEYSDLVRSTIVWLGMDDPCKTRIGIENADPVRVTLGNLLVAWYAIFLDHEKTIKDVIRGIANETNPNKQESLRNALLEIASNGRGEINEIKLGLQLKKFKERIEGGFRLENMGKLQGSIKWRVKKIEDKKS